jgi:small subunit ribosomal protein S4
MARYKDAVCRLCRREGGKLFLKGQRCYGPKCSVTKREYVPGQHGANPRRRPRKPSDFAIQLRQKQRARWIYGVLERQFRRYFTAAERARGITGEELLRRLEMRLDNVILRAGFASSHAQGRQVVRHRHVAVNGRVVDIPSYACRVGDLVEIREKSRSNTKVLESLSGAGSRAPLSWLEVTPETFSIRIVAAPRREDIDTDVNEQLIVEFYSR